jgi:glycosyltransferase involved in cell wall biosynthesis
MARIMRPMADASPLCSVIIPAYQAGGFVAQTIQSVLDQTYPAVEVIVVDDGSTDDTADVVAGFGDAVRLCRQANGGPSAARNTGLGLAQGEFVAFLDADDWWVPERLARCVAFLTEHPDIDVVTTDAWLVDEDVVSDRRFYGDYNAFEFPDPPEQLGAIVDVNFVFVSALMRRELVDRTGPFDPAFRGTEDYDMWIRMLRGGATFGLLREPLAYYRIRAESLSRDPSRQWTQHLNVLEKHLPALWAAGVRGPGGLYFQVARSATNGGRYSHALRFVAMGARAPGFTPAHRARAVARGLVDVARAPVSRGA